MGLGFLNVDQVMCVASYHHISHDDECTHTALAGADAEEETP
ncbi:Hypothetical protein BFF96_0077 [Corynebacterium pseudotuberculosis]|nr:Hypothetical protein BFF96_0077 [Corynebacterium pseudotuberculosis]